MSIRQMEYMLALAENKTLSDAADACFISQSAFSQSLARLENSLGLRLFVRHKNVWTPTDAGVRYLDAAARIVAERDTLLRDLDAYKQKDSHTIALGITLERCAIVFPLVYTRFREEFPDIRLVLGEENVYRLQQMLLRGDLDVALSTVPLAHQSDELRLLDIAPVVTEELVLIVPPSHAFARRKGRGAPPSLEDLAGETFISPPETKALRYYIDEAFRAASAKPLENLEVRSTHSMVEFVGKGMGVSLVPEMFTRDNPSVRVIPMASRMTWDIGVMYRKGKTLSPPEQRLVDIIRDVFGELLRG